MARKSVSVHAERFAIQDIHSGSMVANSEVTFRQSRLYGQVDWICKHWPTYQDEFAPVGKNDPKRT